MRFNNGNHHDWQNCALDEICSKITSGGTPSRKNDLFYTNGDIFWVKTKELNNWYLNDTEEKITEDAIQKSSAKILPRNTILLAMYGATVGELGILNKEMACNQACCALLVNPEKADYRFVFYLLLLFKEQIKSLATGAAQQNLSAKVIKDFSFNYPNLINQKSIADILEDLDKKIAINTQINQTLESMAQAIFKSWFVDFDPVHAKANALADGASDEQATLSAMSVISGKSADELIAMNRQNPEHYQKLWEIANAFPSGFDGEVPLGWGVSKIGESYHVEMGQSPKGETYNELGDGVLFYQGRAEFGWRYPSPRLYTTDPKRMAKQGDVLMSVRAPVGDMNIALEDCCIGRGLCALRHKSGFSSFGVYQLQAMKAVFDVFNGEGTVFGSINQKDLKGLPVIMPINDMMKFFDNFVRPIDEKINTISKENISLQKTRDELLPKLLSGEIEL